MTYDGIHRENLQLNINPSAVIIIHESAFEYSRMPL